MNTLPTEVVIEQYPTYFKLWCDKATNVAVNKNIGEFINKLTEFVYNFKISRYQANYRYMYYDYKDSSISFPINTLPLFISHLGSTPYRLLPMVYIKPKNIKLNMLAHMEPRPEQEDMIDFLSDDRSHFKALSARTGVGKFHGNSTPIKVPGGWRPIGDLSVGDMITAWDGVTSEVVGVYPQGVKDIYRMTFSDGRYLDSGDEHLWRVYYNIDTHIHGEYPPCEIVSTKTIMENIGLINNGFVSSTIHIDYHKNIEDAPDVKLGVSPYLLGTILASGYITPIHVGFNAHDWVVKRINTSGSDYIHTKRHLNMVYSNHCTVIDAGYTWNELRVMGLFKYRKPNPKFIPEVYLNSSYNQRLELARGLLDNDGEVSTGGELIYFFTRYETLAKSACSLFRSLGCWCKLEDSKYRGKYVLKIRHKTPKILLTRPDKVYKLPEHGIGTGCQYLQVMDVKLLDKKEECTCIAIDHPDKLYIAGDWVVTHNTVMTSFALANIKHPSIIFTMGLIEQWKDSLINTTTLEEDDIYIIKGHDSIQKLLNSRGYYPKVMIASIRTMSTYVQATKEPYIHLPTYIEFLKRFGIGISVIDETHMDFHAGTTIMLRTQVKHNIFLSATYERSNPAGAKIFNLVFPSSVIYGQADIKKYTTVYQYGYHIGSNKLKERSLITQNGYSHSKFELRIANDKSMRETFLSKVVDTTVVYYLNVRKPGQKLLIVANTLVMIELIGRYISRKYPSLSMICFSGDDGDDSIVEVEVIVSTIKKSGTGRDIKGLKVTANTISFKASPLCKQLLGRLREIPGEDTYFIDYWCTDLSVHKRHMHKRKEIYMNLAKSYSSAVV